ncbi:MAG: GDSL-type esterase/lipase family protein [Polyangiaceae bacterium]
MAQLAPSPIRTPNPEIEATGDELHTFQEAVARLVRQPQQHLVRVAFYGDSNLTLDHLSGTLRRELQAKLGDGGHGFLGVGAPWRGYRHRDVKRTMVGFWETYIFTRGARPRVGGFGAAGMSAASAEPGAKVKFATASADSPVGSRASRLFVFHHQYQAGGRYRVDIDGQRGDEVNTQGEPEGLVHREFEFEDRAHAFELRNLDKRFVHLYGLALERSSGVVVDTFAVTGATYGGIAKLQDEPARRMLRARRHDLVIVMLGTNFWNSKENVAGLSALVSRHRTDNPKVGVLVLSPPDHVRSKGSASSDPRVVAVANELRAAAKELGVAYWDTRAAMGGDGSMREFYQRGLAGEDLYHLTREGGDLLGRRLAHALLTSHARYVGTHPQAGCAPQSEKSSGN